MKIVSSKIHCHECSHVTFGRHFKYYVYVNDPVN